MPPETQLLKRLSASAQSLGEGLKNERAKIRNFGGDGLAVAAGELDGLAAVASTGVVAGVQGNNVGAVRVVVAAGT